MQHNVENFLCFVLPSTLTNEEYFIIANGKFFYIVSNIKGLNNEHDLYAVHSCDFERMLIVESIIENNFNSFTGRQTGSVDWKKVMKFLGGVSLVTYHSFILISVE
ncbi:MAG: hypothetical protein ACRDFB_02805 [Rhabdochlamydiaceae bacterium]